MRKFIQVRLGKANLYAEECLKDGYVGVGWFGDIDLTSVLQSCESSSDFNTEMIPRYVQKNPSAKKVVAGRFCGFTYTVCKDLQKDDVVLSPRGNNLYMVGKVVGDYEYVPGSHTPHRRKVEWMNASVSKGDFSVALKYSLGSIGTVCNVTSYASEVEKLLNGFGQDQVFSSDPDVEDASVFALERHLEDFLIENWTSTDLSRDYEILKEEGELVGQQYPTDTGPIDILAISNSGHEFLVIELKKGRSSDKTVGQIQRYMGYVKEQLAEDGQGVKGVIIALEDDLGLRRALAVTDNIDFYRYKVDFRLFKQ